MPGAGVQIGREGGEQIDQRAMPDGHALRAPGGAGGVEHIGESGGFGRRQGRRVVRRVRGSSTPWARYVQPQHARRPRGQPRFQLAVREQQRRARVRQHVGQPVRRVRRVERHVRGPRPQYAQQRHHRPLGPVQMHPDQRARSDPRRAQPYRQLHRARPQFRVRQSAAGARDGERVGAGGGLGVEEVDHRTVGRVVPACGVPFAQQQAQFGCGGQRQVRHRQVRVGQRGAQQRLQVPGDPQGLLAVEHPGRVLEAQLAALGALDRLEVKGVTGRPVEDHPAHPGPYAGEFGRGGTSAVAEGRRGEPGPGRQSGDDRARRYGPVPVGLAQFGVQGVDEYGEAVAAPRGRPQRQFVDERADQSALFGPRVDMATETAGSVLP